MQYTFPCPFSSTVRSRNRLAPVPNLGQLPALLKSRFRCTRKRVILFATHRWRCRAVGWVLPRSVLEVNWWSQAGSNRRPPACKAGALPAELWPPRRHTIQTYRTAPAPLTQSDLSLGGLPLVGLGGLEPPTSPLSGVRSNRLSYRPDVTDHPVEARRHPAERYQARTMSNNLCGCICQSPSCFVKGGDPAAGSPTATLLRLHPSHEPYRGKRPPHIFADTGLSYPLLVQPTPMV
jgi:hypothetical protein